MMKEAHSLIFSFNSSVDLKVYLGGVRRSSISDFGESGSSLTSTHLRFFPRVLRDAFLALGGEERGGEGAADVWGDPEVSTGTVASPPSGASVLLDI